MIQWTTEKRKVGDLKPYEFNPRLLTKKQKEDLERSIEKFNLVEIPVINTDNTLLAGHQRIRIMIEKGRTEETIDVRVPSRELTEEEVKEYCIRSNKNTGEWDFEKLDEHFDRADLKDWGFGKAEFNQFPENEDEACVEDDVPSEAKESKVKPGDMYVLGQHRLICGDSTDIDKIKALILDDKADMVFTDPPYNVGYDYGKTYEDGKSVRKNEVFDDEKKNEDYHEFIKKIFISAMEFTKDQATAYCWHAAKFDYLVRDGMEQAGWKVMQTLHWLKDRMNFNKGLDYFLINEPCYFARKKGKKHWFNHQHKTKMQNMADIEMRDFEEIINIIYMRRDSIKEYIHPTQKPVRLAERPIKRHCPPGGLVIDFFGGSGSTLMACEQMNRRNISIELDPKFCDLIITRWENWTGLKAEKA